MSNWRHLQITTETNPKNPLDGQPYVLYNEALDKVWIFLGLHWLLETGLWDFKTQWASDGVWKFFDNSY